MAFIYTRANLKTRINAGIQGKIGMLISDEDLMNDAVREVNNDIDLRSAKREAELSPKLFDGIYDFAAPSDLDANKIIDLPAQVKREGQEFFLITPEEFDRKKENLDGFIAIDDYNGSRILKIALNVDDDTITVSEFDSITSGGGTWSAFGDGTNIRKDGDNYVKGSASLKWDIDSAGGTTAGVQNTALNSFDIATDYLGGNSSAFVYVYLTDKTNVTNFILRLGSSSSNYSSKTVTAQHDGTAFVDGWNLLRFDLTSLTETGTPVNTAIDYAAIYMTKDAAKVSETDYRCDWLVIKKGEIYKIKYYTKYGWQTSAGAYQENSSDDGDLLVADKDEFNLIVTKGRELAAREVNEFETAAVYENQYDKKKKVYILRNPSEAKIMTSEYYNYG